MWRADEKGYSSSRSLEGDQGREGKLDISAFQCVMVSAEIELMFFLVAGTGLCFGFSGRIMLTTRC